MLNGINEMQYENCKYDICNSNKECLNSEQQVDESGILKVMIYTVKETVIDDTLNIQQVFDYIQFIINKTNVRNNCIINGVQFEIHDTFSYSGDKYGIEKVRYSIHLKVGYDVIETISTIISTKSSYYVLGKVLRENTDITVYQKKIQ